MIRIRAGLALLLPALMSRAGVAQDPPPGLTLTVVRTAPFTGVNGFGVTEDTATGEMVFSELNSPWLVEFRAKDLTLIRTITLPIPGTMMPGIGYDETNDTIWATSVTTLSIHEFDKNTGTPTGGIVPIPSAVTPRGLAMKGDIAVSYDAATNKYSEFDFRTGQSLCTYFNPNGPGAPGDGVTFAVHPAFEGELHATAGTVEAGRVTDIFLGNPCRNVPFGQAIPLAPVGEEFAPTGIKSTTDPDPQVDPSEVWYMLAGTSGLIYEVHNPMTVEDCQGADGETVLFVNGESGPRASIVDGWPFHFGIWKPSGGGNGRYLVHLNPGSPNDSTITTLPAGLGSICFPVLLPPFGSASPSAVWNNVGKTGKVGPSSYFGTPIADPPLAPTFFEERIDGDPVNLPLGSTFTLQGVILNPASSSPKQASVTNAILVTVKSP